MYYTVYHYTKWTIQGPPHQLGCHNTHRPSENVPNSIVYNTSDRRVSQNATLIEQNTSENSPKVNAMMHQLPQSD